MNSRKQRASRQFRFDSLEVRTAPSAVGGLASAVEHVHRHGNGQEHAKGAHDAAALHHSSQNSVHGHHQRGHLGGNGGPGRSANSGHGSQSGSGQGTSTSGNTGGGSSHDDPATHDQNDDNNQGTAADNDQNDDNGQDAANHDQNDDNGTDAGTGHKQNRRGR